MAGRPPKVVHVRDFFIAEIDSARVLVSAIDSLPRKVHPRIQVGINPKHVRQVVALAFMGVVAAWEEFLQRSLVRYLAGAEASANYSPTLKYGRADTIGHAYELLSQDANYDPAKHYLKVSEPRWVWRTADFFFSAHPFGVLTNQADLLKNANKIRHRIAHDSEKCKADFKDAALWFMQPANGKLTQGFGPGALLLQTAHRNFGPRLNQANLSHFEAYMRVFDSLARTIVP